MHKVLSSDYWNEVNAHARKATRRQAAIAFVTKEHFKFRKDDILVVNASNAAVSSGETDAKLLQRLYERRVQIYNCPDLHAKVILLDETAVIGSGNMSESSANALVEAGVITDNESTVAGVASLIEQLKDQSEKLDTKQIAKLCQIEVKRRGGRASGSRIRTKVQRLGNQVWLLGVQEFVREILPDEQKEIDEAVDELELPEEEFDWIRWPSNSRFARECREGDRLIQVWSSEKATRPSVVFRSVPILLKQRTRTWTRFYVEESKGKHPKILWGQFQGLLKKLSYSKKVNARTIQLVKPDIADGIAKGWNAAAKS